MRLVLAAIVSFCLMGAACAEERHALLIGNRAYDAKVGPLNNPLNDIAVVGRALKAVGFDKQTPLADQKRAQILAAVRAYARRLSAGGPGAIGFLYYTGHGAAASGTNVNYLIPVDATDPEEDGFWDASVKLDEITRTPIPVQPRLPV